MTSADPSVEQWGIHEISCDVPETGNPFLDVSVSARFTHGSRVMNVPGFYDGGGVSRVRFSPDTLGTWDYQLISNVPAVNGRTGRINCVPPKKGNHGPVHVAHTFHFAYADGTPYRQIGTTAYAWTHQGDELEEQTLATLKESAFNKIRMCVFPKNYAFNAVEPVLYPFEGTPPKTWDTTRLNPAFFQHLEKRVGQLRDLGIEADMILFHPYDKGRWGFDRMDEASDDRYLRYVISRLAAYRNVWWSMANEYDFMKEKKPADWDRYFHITVQEDPYSRLRGIHNGTLIYNQNEPWVTHASVQNGSAVEDFGRAILYRDVYRKPIVFDEVKYEGNIPQRWGNLSAEEMVHRFWQGLIGGTYVGHGETYLHPHDVIWWARGGKLYGQSPARLHFLKGVMESSPARGLEPIDKWQDVHTVGQAGEYYLIYFGKLTPHEWEFSLPRFQLANGMRFTVEILDTWEMTVTPVEGEFTVKIDGTYRYHSEGMRKISLPGKPWIALRVKRVPNDGVVYTGEAKQLLQGE